jgi:tagatose 1,6-diphosphate aldolase
MIGKYRHLSHASTLAGHFVVLAIDHRANLLDSLNTYAPAPLNDQTFTYFKQMVIDTLAPRASAVLTDPAYGIGAAVANRVLPGQVGLLAPVEVTNYDLSPDKREIEFIPGWSVEKIKLAGGDGVKLLLPYHPDSQNAVQKDAIVRQIVSECGKWDIPFFLEPIAYSLDSERPLSNEELRQVTINMATGFSDMGVDVLKLHFPVDPAQNQDENVWRAACESVNASCTVPWTLLSAGVPFDTFLKQARIACQAGASGVIVGRAVWNESIPLQGEERAAFIRTTAVERIDQLSKLCADYATPWFERVKTPANGPDWYQDE